MLPRSASLPSIHPSLQAATDPVSSLHRHFPLVALWHLCSLDAPSVAALWTWFVAYCAGVALPWTSPASMFLAVWMLYATDRLLDARAAASALDKDNLEARHHFHQRHRHGFVIALVCVSFLLAFLLHRLTLSEVRLFGSLGSLLFAYFLLIHLWPIHETSSERKPPRLPKELAVGVFFPAAIFIPTVARAPSLRLFLLPPALLFAAVCILNCLYVYLWEHPDDRSEAHWTTRYATRHLTEITWASWGLSLFTASGAVLLHQCPSCAISCGISLLAFFGLHSVHSRLDPTILRALVDLALLSPILLLLLSPVHA